MIDRPEHSSRRWAPIGLVAIYLGVALTTFLVWWSGDRYTVTGDEPHYLVVAHGLIAHRTLEQSAAYRDEFRTRAIYKPGFAAADSEPTPANTQGVIGPHGLYNKNAFGLPLALLAPFGIAGVFGAKLFLIALSSLVIVLSWKVSGLFSTVAPARVLAVVAATIGAPLILASSQVYPDLPAGLICLGALYWLMTMQRQPSAPRDVLFVLAVAYLPWLHVKYAAAGVIIAAAAAYRLRARTRIAVTALALPLNSILLLAWYHSYAFGSFAGPFGSQPLALTKTAIMVLIGEHFDQNQGFLLQNPIFFVGVLFLAPFALRDKLVGLTFILLLGALLVPGAMHDQYGGYSFVGRFAWAAAAIFIIPTVYGLLWVFGKNAKVFVLLVTCSIVLQAYLFFVYTFTNTDLYRAHAETWLDAYSLFYGPIYRWLPALYHSKWAFFYAPNFIFPAIGLTLLAVGYVAYLRPAFFTPIRSALLAVGVAAAIFAGGLLPCEHCEPGFSVYPASSLPWRTGDLEGSDRVATPGMHGPGHLSFGPYVRLRGARYQLQIGYATDAPAGTVVGHSIVTANEGTQVEVLAGVDLIAPPGGEHVQTVEFVATGRSTSRYGFEVLWDGRFPLRLLGMQLRRIPSRSASQSARVFDEAM